MIHNLSSDHQDEELEGRRARHITSLTSSHPPTVPDSPLDMPSHQDVLSKQSTKWRGLWWILPEQVMTV